MLPHRRVCKCIPAAPITCSSRGRQLRTRARHVRDQPPLLALHVCEQLDRPVLPLREHHKGAVRLARAAAALHERDRVVHRVEAYHAVGSGHVHPLLGGGGGDEQVRASS